MLASFPANMVNHDSPTLENPSSRFCLFGTRSSDRVTFLSHSRRPQGRNYDAGDRIRLLEPIGRRAWTKRRKADGFAAEVRCSTKSEHKVQPSLFTRLTEVEAELLAIKDVLAELKVNQDELRQDRDEWRWRAERLLADLQRGAWWR